jgi:hypothetical protein
MTGNMEKDGGGSRTGIRRAARPPHVQAAHSQGAKAERAMTTLWRRSEGMRTGSRRAA